MNFFVTGTGTGIGKTHVVTQLLLAARAAGMRCAGLKPICCGDRADAVQVLAASSDRLTIDEVNPVWFKTPVAPYAAWLIEQTKVDENAGPPASRPRGQVRSGRTGRRAGFVRSDTARFRAKMGGNSRRFDSSSGS